MKRSIIISLSAFFILMMGVMSCEERDLTFDQSNAFVAFTDPSGGLAENSPEPITIELYYASTSVSSVSVSVGFDATGIDNPAVEGVDFNVLSSKSVSFDSELVQVIEIEAIDNDVQDKDKSVYVTLTGDGGTPIGMGGGANGTYMLTILDNEHPLSNWIGTYDVFADSYGDVHNGEPEGAWDEQWIVTSVPVEGDATKLEMVGIGYGDLPVIVSVDIQTMTITFPAGADAGGSGYGFDNTFIWWGDYLNVAEADVVGTIHEDGSITADFMTMIVPEEGILYIWDSFNTVWTPVAKKTAPAVAPRINKISR